MFEVMKNDMRFCEKFVSLEGEGNTIGESVLFMRLSGGCGDGGLCACKFCDTKNSWVVKSDHKDLKDPSFQSEIVKLVNERDIKRVTLTGGEPLKYVNQFSDFVFQVKFIVPSIKFIGIESNGAMLTDEKNTLILLKEFNDIMKSGVTPSLTISPKIDFDASWYHHKNTDDGISEQSDVTDLYLKAFENIEKIIYPYNVYYKFIYDYTDNTIPWDHTNIFIEKLLDLGVSRERIMLMALTPTFNKPEDDKFWQVSQRATAFKALELGVRYSPRLHVNLGLE